MPETIIYSLAKIKMMKNFNFARFQDFVLSRFKIALQTERYEEQVYFYYAIKICGFDTELERFKLSVLESKNQILISYFLIDKVITEKDYQQYIAVPEEGEWLQNYHYLLVYNNTEVDILLPENAKREKQKTTYRKFYELNLSNKIAMVRPIDKVGWSVDDFIAKKLDTYKGII